MTRKILDDSLFQHAADWVFGSREAEDRLGSIAIRERIAAALDRIDAGFSPDVDDLAAAIGGPRVVAEALVEFILWRVAPPAMEALQ